MPAWSTWPTPPATFHLLIREALVPPSLESATYPLKSRISFSRHNSDRSQVRSDNPPSTRGSSCPTPDAAAQAIRLALAAIFHVFIVEALAPRSLESATYPLKPRISFSRRTILNVLKYGDYKRTMSDLHVQAFAESLRNAHATT